MRIFEPTPLTAEDLDVKKPLTDKECHAVLGHLDDLQEALERDGMRAAYATESPSNLARKLATAWRINRDEEDDRFDPTQRIDAGP